MTQTLIALLLLPILGISALAKENDLSVHDLNKIKITGELGVPLHTVHKVTCQVVDMTFTRAKADNGRLAFQIISVDGKKREEKHYIDIPKLDQDQKKPKAGMVYHFWAYETVQASGFPTEAFDKLGELAFANTDLHFRSNLIILKMLEIKDTE